MPSEGANNRTVTVQALSYAVIGANGNAGQINPAAVAGSDSCKKCHASELAALMDSKHHDSLKLIQKSGGNVAKYARAVGIPEASVTKDLICVRCHGTPKGAGIGVHAIGSVSCESCHGGSVGNPEWLVRHAQPGIAAAGRAACDKAGMIRSSNIYAIAKNCFECHVVSNEELVIAGHPASNKIEFVGWSSGEVRHNFQVNQKVNAEAPSLWLKINKGASAENRTRVKFVVGVLVDLEVTLNNARNATKTKSDFVKGCAKRLKNSKKLLDKIIEELDGNAPADILDAQAAIEKMGKITSTRIKNIGAAGAAYLVVAKAARAFETKFDGSELQALEKLITKEAKPKGKVYSP
jgi:hypothetical protein